MPSKSGSRLPHYRHLSIRRRGRHNDPPKTTWQDMRPTFADAVCHVIFFSFISFIFFSFISLISTRLATSVMAAASARYFSSVTTRTLFNEAARTWIRAPVVDFREKSTAVLKEKEVPEEKSAEKVPAGGSGKDEKALASYWGIESGKIKKEDGSEWKWSCFRPWETYQADTSIDLTKHHKPDTLMDKMAYWTVKSLRWPTDLFFQRRYGCRAMMLETVAAVPGMVGGMLLHCKSSDHIPKLNSSSLGCPP